MFSYATAFRQRFSNESWQMFFWVSRRRCLVSGTTCFRDRPAQTSPRATPREEDTCHRHHLHMIARLPHHRATQHQWRSATRGARAPWRAYRSTVGWSGGGRGASGHWQRIAWGPSTHVASPHGCRAAAAAKGYAGSWRCPRRPCRPAPPPRPRCVSRSSPPGETPRALPRQPPRRARSAPTPW